MRKILVFATLLFCASDAWAINKYARTVGGNWTADATWSTTSGGAADTVAPTASDDVFLDANSGNVTISATSVGKSLTCTGYTGTLTHNAFRLTLSGNCTLVSGMTYTPSAVGSELSFNNNGTLTSGSKKLWSLEINAGATVTLGDNLDFVAQKTARITIAATALNLNGKTVSGNSSINRVLVQSGTLGTARTVTVASGTFANADFRDITFSSASNLDLSAITGGSGDAGGNTITGGGTVLTFTTAATQTYTGGTGSWSDNTKWTSRVPLPQDDVSMSGVTGGTITADMPRLGKSIDWTGASGTPTASLTSTSNTIYGSLTLISAMTWTCNQILNYEGRSTFTLTTSGKNMGSATPVIAMVGGTLTFQDSYLTSVGLTLSNGTLNTNGMSVAALVLTSSGTNTRTLNITNSTLTMSRTSSSAWDAGTVTNMTFVSTGSTIIISDIGASSKTFAGGGLTYNDLKIAGGGAGAVILTGANTFNRIYTDGGGTKTITLPGGTNTTILSNEGLGNGTNVITFTASSGSATVVNSSGDLSWDYVNLTNIPCSGAGRCYAGANSTDNGGNTNWLFTAPPDVSTVVDEGMHMNSKRIMQVF